MVKVRSYDIAATARSAVDCWPRKIHDEEWALAERSDDANARCRTAWPGVDIVFVVDIVPRGSGIGCAARRGLTSAASGEIDDGAELGVGEWEYRQAVPFRQQAAVRDLGERAQFVE